MTGTISGCPACGGLRFDPIKIDDNGDMLLKCKKCGEVLIVKNAWEAGRVDKNGNALSQECIDKMRDQLDGRQVS